MTRSNNICNSHLIRIPAASTAYEAQDVKTNFDHALEDALQLAKSLDADYLPGWCGPVADECQDSLHHDVDRWVLYRFDFPI
jgi:hypothetical protein